ncbi:unnamed protein product [Sphagnum jensenii]|uniref:PORR domain-containing protein n=1 Tax=Sphagnum jensenii TaxID=128206 RepID=A0ABP1BIL6_9BRYO
MRQKEEMEELLIEKLQKLIMMSIDRRIPPKKIGHIRRELGLPDEFRMHLVKKYPQYMQVVETERLCFGPHSIGSSPGHNCLGNVHTRESGSKEGAGRGAFQETGRSARSNCESPEEWMAELAAQGKKAETIDENSDDDWDDDNEQADDSVRDWKVGGKQIHEPDADLSCFTV